MSAKPFNPASRIDKKKLTKTERCPFCNDKCISKRIETTEENHTHVKCEKCHFGYIK